MKCSIRFEILTALLVTIQVFWDVMSYLLVRWKKSDPHYGKCLPVYTA